MPERLLKTVYFFIKKVYNRKNGILYCGFSVLKGTNPQEGERFYGKETLLYHNGDCVYFG